MDVKAVGGIDVKQRPILVAGRGRGMIALGSGGIRRADGVLVADDDGDAAVGGGFGVLPVAKLMIGESAHLSDLAGPKSAAFH